MTLSGAQSRCLSCLGHCLFPSGRLSYQLPFTLFSEFCPPRSLLCTVTNETPHERFFKFNRRSSTGESLPAWLTKPGSVLLKRQIRNKNDPLVAGVEYTRIQSMLLSDWVTAKKPPYLFVIWHHALGFLSKEERCSAPAIISIIKNR